MKGHGAHNEAACDLLHKAGGFPDWVVTTAFYAAMHGIYENLFPLKEAGSTYPTFDAYYGQKFARRAPGDKPNKHDATVDLVRTHLPAIASNYRLLKDSCFNARYRNYAVKPFEAAMARTQLQAIKGKLKAKGK